MIPCSLAACSLSHNYFPTAGRSIKWVNTPKQIYDPTCSLWLTHSLSHCDCVLPPLGNKSSLDQLVSHTLGVQSGGVQHSTAVCWLGCADLHNCCFRRMAFRFGSFIIVFLLFVCVIWFLLVAFCERRQSQPLFGHFNTSANRGDSEEEEEKGGELQSRKMRLGHTPARFKLRGLHQLSQHFRFSLFPFAN